MLASTVLRRNLEEDRQLSVGFSQIIVAHLLLPLKLKVKEIESEKIKTILFPEIARKNFYNSDKIE